MLRLGWSTRKKLVALIIDTKIPKYDRKIEIKKLLYQMTSHTLAKTFAELIKTRKTPVRMGPKPIPDVNLAIKRTNYNVLADAKTPIGNRSNEKTIEIIPKDFYVENREVMIDEGRAEEVVEEEGEGRRG